MERPSELDQMLSQAQQALSCPVCHRSFEHDELRLRGMVAEHAIIQASCSDHHNLTVVIFVAHETEAARSTTREKPLTANDVLELHRAIETFDGNFRKYFNSKS